MMRRREVRLLFECATIIYQVVVDDSIACHVLRYSGMTSRT